MRVPTRDSIVRTLDQSHKRRTSLMKKRHRSCWIPGTLSGFRSYDKLSLPTAFQLLINEILEAEKTSIPKIVVQTDFTSCHVELHPAKAIQGFTMRCLIVRLMAVANAIGGCWVIILGLKSGNEVSHFVYGHWMLVVAAGFCGLDNVCEVASNLKRKGSSTHSTKSH